MIGLFLDSREEELGSDTTLYRCLKYFVVCVISTHWICCVWYSLACSGYHSGYPETCGNDSWNFRHSDRTEFHDPFASYLESLYWTMATVTSTGYNPPKNLSIMSPLLQSELPVVATATFLRRTGRRRSSRVWRWCSESLFTSECCLEVSLPSSQTRTSDAVFSSIGSPSSRKLWSATLKLYTTP